MSSFDGFLSTLGLLNVKKVVHTLKVGLNYPWPRNQLITIGPTLSPRGAPQPWRTTTNATFVSNLATLKAAGISVVRMWLMGNGHNYDGYVSRTLSDTYDFEPPGTIPQAFLDDFSALLQIFKTAQLQIIPVLIDFPFFDEPDVDTVIGKDFTVGNYPPPIGVVYPTNLNYGKGRRTIATNSVYRDKFISGTLVHRIINSKHYEQPEIVL